MKLNTGTCEGGACIREPSDRNLRYLIQLQKANKNIDPLKDRSFSFNTLKQKYQMILLL